ncbi:GAF domain-containing protein [Solitalea lacus]|uniref:GAF domain-containing protein n=1 Tax=Solitalea lacus TaxID=2911172 RepID=UPI001EDC3656|nr:hypothetical protein [Solitalea lacus]UKJ05804.1 hypothetical protein L2B55_09610 [Solitalea lacus]
MEDVFVSELRDRRKFRLLYPEPDVACELPNIPGKLTFLPFINFLKERLSTTSDIQAQFYRHLIKRFEAQPALLQTIEDPAILDANEDLIELLTFAIFPVVGEKDKSIYTLAIPNRSGFFCYSDPFKKLFLDEKEEFVKLPADIPIDRLRDNFLAAIYESAFRKYYGIHLNNSAGLICSFTDPSTDLIRYYRLCEDRRFVDVQLNGDLPKLEHCGICLNTFRILDIEKLMKQMPLEMLSLEGFSILTAEDVTTDESVEEIKKILLSHDSYETTYLEDLKQAVRTLVGLNDLEVGLMPFVKINDQFVLEEEYTSQSLLGKRLHANEADTALYNMLIEFLSNQHPEPVAIANVTEDLIHDIPFLSSLKADGVKSYIVYPMQNSDGLLGLLELASKVPHQLNFEILTRLEPIIPLLSLAMCKNKEQFTGKIERLIKDNFTALQPSVHWKFEEVAWEYLRNKAEDASVLTGNVVFDNVHPLYGAIDIRNSSVERNHAIQRDLKEQLNLIGQTLDKLDVLVQLPLLEGLKFKNQAFQKAIEDVLLAEDEVRINEFLENEVEPILQHLQKSNSQAQVVVENYYGLLNPHDGHLYQFRREYEETLAQINDAVIRYLEEEEENIQQSYPHYFEKYRTDGVEYNIYIGQSIAPQKPFDSLYLKNLRLWQLKSMAEIARITHHLAPSLKVPLQTTQLILIHSQPIAISFRKDERRFDVEGSYNIRYEIMKKRIDKVHLKDSTERLTQPGKLALVYFNQKETDEYQQYINFLQSKEILKSGIEFLELEELQGVKGLKAMRVDVNLEGIRT